MKNDDLVPSWLASEGSEKTVDDVKQSIKREFPEVLASLRRVAAQDPDFLEKLFTDLTPGDTPPLLRKLAARGRGLTGEQLRELHEFTSSLFKSLLKEGEGGAETKNAACARQP
jgi:hypothetical protein